MKAISATRTVGAPVDDVFAYLEDLCNHWRLTDRWVTVIDLSGPSDGATGATVQLRGPLGIRRTARTTVLESRAPRELRGLAEVAPRTSAQVNWTRAFL